MLYGGGIFGLAIVVLWVWAVLDVISTDESLCRNLPKTMWLMVVIFLSGLGALAWLLLGRPENASFRPGAGTARPTAATPRGFEDSRQWDARSG
ncbi:MAG: PLDc N-terminal domain-containing protein, partial [Actinomycetota bacterium]|nr:PLDc N-terminal domain-containing protein [Actinomycetota bacterium]